MRRETKRRRHGNREEEEERVEGEGNMCVRIMAIAMATVARLCGQVTAYLQMDLTRGSSCDEILEDVRC